MNSPDTCDISNQASGVRTPWAPRSTAASEVPVMEGGRYLGRVFGASGFGEAGCERFFMSESWTWP